MATSGFWRWALRMDSRGSSVFLMVVLSCNLSMRVSKMRKRVGGLA